MEPNEHHQHLAWTGGDRPPPVSQFTGVRRRYMRSLFRELCREYINFWGDLPRDVARSFFTNAKYDAHASYRDLPV